MKKLIIAAVIIVFGFSANADANTNYSKRVGGYFYTSLSPYGTWIEIGFGTPVWRPTIMKRNWSPYNQGQWIYTDYGWYWDSYEPFGQVVYHYGRWYYDDYYGWIWIPDYEWAPAWVDWRYDDNYIGWAPLSPYALFSINIGIHYTYDYYVPYNHWSYVQYDHFCDNNVYNYYVAPKYKYRVHNGTKMRTNYSYYDGRVRNDGVDYDRIRERSGRTIEKRNIVSVNDPRELSRERNSKNRNKEIKTYFANQDDISRDGLRDVKVEKKDRKSTLEISKVELGRERTLDRTKDLRKNENREVINIERNRTDDTRKVTSNDVTLNKIEDERKIQERKDADKRNSDIEKRNNEQKKRTDEIRKSEEVKRIEQNKRNEQVNIQRNANDDMKKRIDETLQKREEKKSTPEVLIKNNERKVEQKKESQIVEQRNQNINENRNTEVKRNNSDNKTETKENTRTSDKNNRTKSR